MIETVAVLGTFQTPFKTRHPEHTFAEQAQIAAAGALHDAGMTPDDINATLFSLAPTHFMGVADADRWAIDYIFGAGKPMLRVHTGGATGGSAVQAAYNLVRAGLFRSVLIVGAERISETPDAQNVLNLIFDVFYERDMPLSYRGVRPGARHRRRQPGDGHGRRDAGAEREKRLVLRRWRHCAVLQLHRFRRRTRPALNLKERST